MSNYNQPPNYFNTNTSHPLIKNAEEYIFYKKYVSIHSEDRDMIKFQNSSEFEIEMPEDLLNVAGIRLFDWTFPANYSPFSHLNSNVQMTFKINTPYKPTEPLNTSQKILNQYIYLCLSDLSNTNFRVIIEEGFYTPQQMVTELTNKFNNVVTKAITNYLTQNELNEYLTQFNTQDGYTNFKIVYNTVGQRIWFGNICDGFILTNSTNVIEQAVTDNLYCGAKAHLPDFSKWGLPCNLGLTRCNSNAVNTTTSKSPDDPRFFYGDVNSGDKGNWLVPNVGLYPGSQVWWFQCDYKINLLGHAYFYMELEGHNCINETSPYNISPYTFGTNGTNGIVNSSFAKIAVPTTPITQWFEKNILGPHKAYIPPAERMRRLKFKIRYHNGMLVNFGVFNYSFTLEFTLQSPQIVRESKAKIYPPII
jgi:hypothetical protein